MQGPACACRAGSHLIQSHWHSRMAHSFNGVDLPFLDRIHHTVLEALQLVEGEGEISRDRRLHALFNDLTCRIDSEVRRTSPSLLLHRPSFYILVLPPQTHLRAIWGLGVNACMLPSHSPLLIALSPLCTDHFNNEVPAAQRYYVIMAHYYLEFPDKAEEALSKCLHLWNSLHMPLIFALLFHEYVRTFCRGPPRQTHLPGTQFLRPVALTLLPLVLTLIYRVDAVHRLSFL